MSSDRTLRGRLASVFLLAVSSLVALAAAEAAVRIAAPQTLNFWTEDPATGLAALRPNRSVTVYPWGHEVQSNSEGFRDVEWRSPPGRPRILVMGDSFGEAIQVPLDDSFARQLEQGLEARGIRDAEVLNAGISGWGTDAQLRYFEKAGREIRPDVVLVLFTVYNDVHDNLEWEYHQRVDDGFVPRVGGRRSGLDLLVNSMKRGIGGRSHLYQLARHRLRSGDTQSQFSQLEAHWVDLIKIDPPPVVEQGWSDTREFLTVLQDSATAVGAELMVVPIPMEIELDSDLMAAFADAHGVSETDVDPSLPTRTLATWAAASGADLVDLAPALGRAHAAGKQLYLPGDGHWSVDGHHAAARAVAEHLSRRFQSDVAGTH